MAVDMETWPKQLKGERSLKKGGRIYVTIGWMPTAKIIGKQY